MKENVSGCFFWTQCTSFNEGSSMWQRDRQKQTNKRISLTLRISAGEMYRTICVEWAEDHFDHGLM